MLPNVPVVAPIASLGHTGAASGSISLATAAMMIARNIIPPTIGDPSSKPSVNVDRNPRPLTGDHVLCLTHTSEGNATAVVLAKP